MEQQEPVPVGKITGTFGVKGWVKITSFTDPKINIVDYTPWIIKGKKPQIERSVSMVKQQTKGFIAKLDGIDTPEEAALYKGSDILVYPSQFKEPGLQNYFWLDLIGLDVVTIAGANLGQVSSLIETGANDVLVVDDEKEHLIPFVLGIYVLKVELDQKKITVDWDPDS
ncbi:MAG: ribosome maturation factor RimM [Methylococcaceae bacterium]